MRPAGWGTDHPHLGRCKLHGGRSPGGPPGNKKHLIHGLHEQLAYTEDESILLDNLDLTTEEVIKTRLQLTTIRLGRMMKRIWRVESGEQANDGMVRIRVTKGSRSDDDQHTDTTEVYEGTLKQILEIETAITAIQNLEARLLDTRNRHTMITKGEEDQQGRVLVLEVPVGPGVEAIAEKYRVNPKQSD